MIDGFLREYMKSIDVPYVDTHAALRHLCERYTYSPKNRKLIDIAYGWLWGKFGNEAFANCHAALLEKEASAMYEIVARENGWAGED